MVGSDEDLDSDCESRRNRRGPECRTILHDPIDRRDVAFPSFPPHLMQRECSLNTRCVCGEEIVSSLDRPTGVQLTFTWPGPRLPDHIQKLVYALCVLTTHGQQKPDAACVAVVGLTRFDMIPNGKKSIVTGLLARMQGESCSIEYEQHLPDMGNPRETYPSEVRREFGAEEVYVESQLISAVVGTIPVVFNDTDGVEHRIPITVMKVKFVAGFEFPSALSILRKDKNMDAHVVADVFRCIKAAIAYEAEVNLGVTELFGSSSMPHPLTVHGFGKSTIFNIASPFQVLSKILRMGLACAMFLQPIHVGSTSPL